MHSCPTFPQWPGRSSVLDGQIIHCLQCSLCQRWLLCTGTRTERPPVDKATILAALAAWAADTAATVHCLLRPAAPGRVRATAIALLLELAAAIAAARPELAAADAPYAAEW